MFKYFFNRELYGKYKNNILGVFWTIIQPLILLAIYSVIFEKIFKAKVPEASDVGFTVYMALGFWPWLAFSESIIRSITAIEEKKELIGKINLNLKLPLFATISATFVLNIVGYIVVLLILIIIGKNFNYSAIPLLLIPLIQLYVFAIALGLLLSSVQIFIKDTQHLMTTLMTLWFFLTPIIYSESIMPESIKSLIQFNPIYTPIVFIHNALLTDKELPWFSMFVLSISIIIFLWITNKIFDRLSPRFDDFI